jgi:hypothetical protein
MYWNNPILEINWPSKLDPIADSLHSGQHCLFYNPAQDKNQIKVNRCLQDLCDWANTTINSQGIDRFLVEPKNHNYIANLVKVNIWVDDLARQGSVKPMLLHYTDHASLTSATGESRLRAIERINSITTVSVFISTHAKYQDHFFNLEPVTTFDQFAKLCSAELGQKFLFRLTDFQAPYGLDWYEYNSSRTTSVTPGSDYCLAVMSSYLKQHPNIIFTPNWFDHLIDWEFFQS